MEKKIKDVVTSTKRIDFLRENGRNDTLIRKSHTHGLVLVALILMVGSPIASATSAHAQDRSTMISEHIPTVHEASGPRYIFLGLVRDLQEKDNHATCYALVFFSANLSVFPPKIIHVAYGKQIVLDNPFYYRHIHFWDPLGINVTIIFGICDNIEINDFFTGGT